MGRGWVSLVREPERLLLFEDGQGSEPRPSGPAAPRLKSRRGRGHSVLPEGPQRELNFDDRTAKRQLQIGGWQGKRNVMLQRTPPEARSRETRCRNLS